EDSLTNRHGSEPGQMHRLPHLLDHLQERLDQPRRHGIRLVQQRRIEPGIGYPKEWENQDKWKGGWVV
ncbi:Respiratory nitrate reductase beta chain (EC 1.7.99.4), partial [Pseudomonas sp. FEN]